MFAANLANPVTMKAKYYNGPAEIVFAGVYADQSLAIKIVSPEGEPLFTATVCIAEYGFTPGKGYVVIKNYSENEGVLESMVAGGWIEPPFMEVEGPNDVTFPVCKLTEKAGLAILGLI